MFAGGHVYFLGASQAAQGGVKSVLAMFDECEFYYGPEFDMDAMMIISFWDDEANEKMAPKFWFVKLGLEEEKC
jgi:hypothetical protein